jgi:hypothetical protein
MRIGIEIRDPDLYDPTVVAMWDTTATWDDTVNENNTWDDASALFDARDELRGFVLDVGRQSSWDDLLAGTLMLELDNNSGIFSIFGHQQVPRIRPGFNVVLDCQWDGVWYPQFRGEITEYIESGKPGDHSVQLKAVDLFRRLQDPIEGDYHAGTDAQTVVERLRNIMEMAGLNMIPFNAQVGTATMTNYATTRSLLDEMKVTSHSDCGVFFIDKDGTAIYLNRDRIYGRPPIRSLLTFGDGCDGTELPYAAVDPIVADNEFGNVVTVSNVSQGTDSPQAGIAVDVDSIATYTRIPWAPQQLLICNAEFVQGAADFHLRLRSTAWYRINSFECYPAHDDRLWPALLGMRLYDLISVIRRPPEANAMMGLMVVDGMRIEGTPNMWKFTIRCSPASGFAENVIVWNDGVSQWDGTLRWA